MSPSPANLSLTVVVLGTLVLSAFGAPGSNATTVRDCAAALGAQYAALKFSENPEANRALYDLRLVRDNLKEKRRGRPANIRPVDDRVGTKPTPLEWHYHGMDLRIADLEQVEADLVRGVPGGILNLVRINGLDEIGAYFERLHALHADTDRIAVNQTTPPEPTSSFFAALKRGFKPEPANYESLNAATQTLERALREAWADASADPGYARLEERVQYRFHTAFLGDYYLRLLGYDGNSIEGEFLADVRLKTMIRQLNFNRAELDFALKAKPGDKVPSDLWRQTNEGINLITFDYLALRENQTPSLVVIMRIKPEPMPP